MFSRVELSVWAQMWFVTVSWKDMTSVSKHMFTMITWEIFIQVKAYRISS